MLADSDWSEEEEQAPYAYWETKSILELHGAPPLRRPSQRSTAPSPSLAVTANGTPKLKRTTANASLPSPSASASFLDDAKALRQKKRRRAAAGKKRRAAVTAAAQPEPSGEPFDAQTLEVLNQLAKKIQARSAGHGSPVPGRTRASSLAAGSGATDSTARSPLRRAATATCLSTDVTTTTPLRLTSARKARQQQPAAQTLLNLSATKFNVGKTSPRGTTFGKLPPVDANVNLSPSTTAAAVPATAEATMVAHNSPATVPAEKKEVSEAEEDYFDDDDFSFEAALSQLDVSHLVPTPSHPHAQVAAASPALPSSQASETLQANSYGTEAAATATRAVPLPPLRKAESTPVRRHTPPPPRPHGARPVSVPPPPRPPHVTTESSHTATATTAAMAAAAPSAAAIKPTPKPSLPPNPNRARTVPAAAPATKPPGVRAALVRTTSASKLLSASERSALDELAQKEMAALAELDDVDLWNDADDDDPF